MSDQVNDETQSTSDGSEIFGNIMSDTAISRDRTLGNVNLNMMNVVPIDESVNEGGQETAQEDAPKLEAGQESGICAARTNSRRGGHHGSRRCEA